MLSVPRIQERVVVMKMRDEMTEEEKRRLDALTLLQVYAEMHRLRITPVEPYDHELFRNVGEDGYEEVYQWTVKELKEL